MINFHCRHVSLELLRPGPPHNQLLSPLTDYFGIAAQGSAATINFPYEHGEFLRRLADLRYPFATWPKPTDPAQAEFLERTKLNAEKERQIALLELSTKLTKALCQVPGLPAQLGSRGCSGDELVHLEVVVSAAELAMLPFELLGNVEQGPVQPGRFLLLAGAPPVCLTRRVRNVSGDCVRWTRTPRILFVPAAPGGREIPLFQHQHALQKALAPWVIFDPNAEQVFYEELNKHLTVLDKPSIAKIARACSKGEYTHVHILAHGEPLPEAPGGGFGVALHSDKEPSAAHIVAGDRLASAMQRDGGGCAPIVVTLAMCDSGAVSDVLYTGASFAHDLHRAGIPFVVASQFPLAFNGSVLVAEKLYECLLQGDDPRRVLVDVRTRLHALYADESHDWASLVVYASLPSDMEAQLEQLRYEQTRRAFDAALGYADDVLWRRGNGGAPAEKRSAKAVVERVRSAEKKLPVEGRYRSEGLGLRAAAHKRLSHALFSSAKQAAGDDESEQVKTSVEQLREALRLYEHAAREGLLHRPNQIVQHAALHWGLTQLVSLRLVLEGSFDAERWSAAHVSAQVDSRHGVSREIRVWGYSSLLELALLKAWIQQPAADTRHFQEAIEGFLAETVPGDFPIYSTTRQLRRYLEWWWSKEMRDELPSDAVLVVPEALRDAVIEATDRLERVG